MNYLFIQLLYKINITFVIVLMFGEKKRHSLIWFTILNHKKY